MEKCGENREKNHGEFRTDHVKISPFSPFFAIGSPRYNMKPKGKTRVKTSRGKMSHFMTSYPFHNSINNRAKSRGKMSHFAKFYLLSSQRNYTVKNEG